MKAFIVVTLPLFAAIFLCEACNDESKKMKETVSSEPANLNAIITELPEAPGQEAFKEHCISCHSARYVQMQPELSEKSWTAVVTKMQKAFGAPVSDSTAKEIVRYLSAIKGKK